MTVTYTAEVATSHFGTFWRLLLRWKGSVYKLLWVELLIFVVAYFTISFIYRFALPENHKRTFERISIYCELYNNLIPMAFVLGFYVSIVVTRWWEEFMSIPWPDKMALYVTANIHGHDDRGRLIRRTIMRYICLSFVMTARAISTAVKKRFPTDDHLTEAGLQTENEQKIIEGVKTNNSKYFVPLVWTTSIISRARKEGRIRDDFAMKTLVEELNFVRGQLGGLLNYDWINVPLIYTQVVTMAVYTFFLSCLMGRQFLDPQQGYDNHQIDFYIPIFTILQFIFYMGWLKVAESLLNPFGEDDDDFEMNWLIDRNLQVAYLIVDEMHSEHPDLIKDQFWDEADFTLPYNAASEQFKVTDPHVGSAADIEVPEHASEFVPLASIPEEPVHAISTPQDVPRESTAVRFNNLSSRKRRHRLNLKNSEILDRHSPRSMTSQQEEDIFMMSDLSVEKAGVVDQDQEAEAIFGGNPSERTLTSDSVQNVSECKT
ncbi:bestrophin-2 [Lingula anatina]|uniref:Bestrophin homolog n=1 Tax=Lingula anatina TaxID=7574 RepID=A0A1S3K2B3_LINAN|nr:bestrophin-2 [Lingula anatina]|eukprot:XP_013416778.1 bestrophin-2 [Lingula anatina]